MLTKAVVVEVINTYQARVRIPIINKAEGAAAATPNDMLYIATISTSLGVKPAIKVNDVVFVEFEEDTLSMPVIIGSLARENDTSSCNIHAQSLKVVSRVDLPADTFIGNEETNLSEVVKLLSNVNDLRNTLTQDISIVAKLIEEVKKLNEKVSELDTKVDGYDSRIATVEAKVNTYDSRIETLESKSETFESDIDSLKNTVVDLQRQIDELQPEKYIDKYY